MVFLLTPRSPVHSARKFSLVRGTTPAYSSKTIRPTFTSHNISYRKQLLTIRQEFRRIVKEKMEQGKSCVNCGGSNKPLAMSGAFQNLFSLPDKSIHHTRCDSADIAGGKNIYVARGKPTPLFGYYLLTHRCWLLLIYPRERFLGWGDEGHGWAASGGWRRRT